MTIDFKRGITLVLFVLTVFISCKKDIEPVASIEVNEQDLKLRMNQIQVIASHNSYRLMTTDTVYSFLLSIQTLIPPQYNPIGLDYTHLPIKEQMDDYNIRGLELDVYNDPNGNVFYERRIDPFVGLPISSGVTELSQPGFKVLHIKDVDYNTQFYTFKQALLAIQSWSNSHSNHLPLFINIETKSDSPGDDSTLSSLGFLKAPLWDVAATEALEQEITDVFGISGEGLFKPSDLQGTYSSLEQAALNNNWPLLKDCRGKIVFIIEGNAVAHYKSGHPSLIGRKMFVYDTPGQIEAAFLLLNDARTDSAAIKDYVRDGYIVRTRCDEGTIESRYGDYSGMYAAFESGAQILSTDYYKADSRGGTFGWSDYHVNFPNRPKARKNPINANTINVNNDIDD